MAYNSIPPTDTEAQFLDSYDPSRYPHPSLSIDVVVATVDNDVLKVILLHRSTHPSLGTWCLPGGFVGEYERLDAALLRVLHDKTGFDNIYVEQLATFDRLDRDPRHRVVSIAYLALVDAGQLRALTQNSANAVTLATINAPWRGETGGPVTLTDSSGNALEIAFDHTQIIATALVRLRGKLDYAPVGYQFLPRQFTLAQLQDIHQAILGRPLNKAAFRKKILSRDQLIATGDYEVAPTHRPAQLYRFKDQPPTT
jgi:8-oxo-dGTP diphosphatase